MFVFDDDMTSTSSGRLAKVNHYTPPTTQVDMYSVIGATQPVPIHQRAYGLSHNVVKQKQAWCPPW